MELIRTLATLGFCLLTASAVAAEGITEIKVEPASAGAASKITIHGSADQNFCGMRVEFGDGDGDNVKINKDEGIFPRTLIHTYKKPGSYTVTATGKKVTTHFPCLGAATATVSVGGKGVTAPAAAATSEASCPAGWQLVKGSAKKDGSFACEAQKPADRMQCGSGLKYFEKGGQIGCKKAGK